MKSLESILHLADNKLDEIAREGGFRSREDVESAMQLVKMAKDAYCIFEMDEDGSYGESYRSGGYRDGENPRRMYRDGREYNARGGNARRDSRGRYMDDGFADKLRDMMRDAPDEQTRNNIRKMLENIEA